MDAQVAPLGGRTMLGLYSVVLGVSVCASERVCGSVGAGLRRFSKRNRSAVGTDAPSLARMPGDRC